MMLAGALDKRVALEKKFLARPEIKSIRVIRSNQVNAQFQTPGKHTAEDGDEHRALAGEEVRLLRDGDEGRIVSVLLPMAAGHEMRGTDCMICHVAEPGDITGVVRVDYSLANLDAATLEGFIGLGYRW